MGYASDIEDAYNAIKQLHESKAVTLATMYRNRVVIGDTNGFVNLGIGFKISASHLRLQNAAGRPLGLEDNPKIRYNNIPLDTLKKLPEAINRPIGIFQAKNNPRLFHILTGLTEAFEKPTGEVYHNPIVITVEQSTHPNDVNRLGGFADVRSIYGHNPLQLRKLITEQNTIHWDKQLGEQVLDKAFGDKKPTVTDRVGFAAIADNFFKYENFGDVERNNAFKQRIAELDEIIKHESPIKAQQRQDRELTQGQRRLHSAAVGQLPDIIMALNRYAELRIFTANCEMNEHTVRKDTNRSLKRSDKAHDLPIEYCQNVFEAISNPIAIIREPNSNGISVLTDLLTDEQDPVLVSLHLNKLLDGKYSNDIATMFGKGNFHQFFQAASLNGGLIYLNEVKAREVLGSLPKSRDKNFNNFLNNIINHTNNLHAQFNVPKPLGVSDMIERINEYQKKRQANEPMTPVPNGIEILRRIKNQERSATRQSAFNNVARVNSATPVAQTADPKFSVSQAPIDDVADEAAQQREMVRDKLVQYFGEDGLKRLENEGKLTILDDYPVADVEGVFENGQVYLVAKNLKPETVIPVVIHEMGGHAGLQSMMPKEQHDFILGQFHRLVATGDTLAVRAKELADRNPQTAESEYLPYYLTLKAAERGDTPLNAKDKNTANLVSRTTASVKAWFFDRLGVPVSMNSNDMFALGKRMVYAFENADKQELAGELTNAVPQFSVRADEDTAPAETTEFYSALARELANSKIKSAKPDSWRQEIASYVTNGKVKKDEVNFSGIQTWLDNQNGRISKEDIVEYAEDTTVAIEFTQLTGENTQFGQYATPGSKAYREVLVRYLPSQFYVPQRKENDSVTNEVFLRERDAEQFVNNANEAINDNIEGLTVEFVTDLPYDQIINTRQQYLNKLITMDVTNPAYKEFSEYLTTVFALTESGELVDNGTYGAAYSKNSDQRLAANPQGKLHLVLPNEEKFQNYHNLTQEQADEFLAKFDKFAPTKAVLDEQTIEQLRQTATRHVTSDNSPLFQASQGFLYEFDFEKQDAAITTKQVNFALVHPIMQNQKAVSDLSVVLDRMANRMENNEDLDPYDDRYTTTFLIDFNKEPMQLAEKPIHQQSQLAGYVESIENSLNRIAAADKNYTLKGRFYERAVERLAAISTMIDESKNSVYSMNLPVQKQALVTALPFANTPYLRYEATTPNFNTSDAHFTQSNVVSSIRYSEFEIDGQKILKAEEYQNDTSQRYLAQLKKFNENPTTAAKPSPLPNMPYLQRTDDWVRIDIKKTFEVAVNEGFDKVIFVSGEEAAKRFGLEKHYREIEYTGDSLTVKGRNANDTRTIFNVNDDNLDEYIGKDLSERILQQTPIDGTRKLVGDDLIANPKGMLVFYNEIVKSNIDKFLKPYGHKAAYQDVPGLGVHYAVDITPDLKQQLVNKGIAWYSMKATDDQVDTPVQSLNEVRQALVNYMGETTLKSLEHQNKLEIVDVHPIAGMDSEYKDGKITLVASSLTRKTIVPTLLQKLGESGRFENLLNEKQRGHLLEQFNAHLESGDELAIEAKRLAEQNNKAQSDYLPYYLSLAAKQQQPNSFFGNVVSSVKNWAFGKLGVELELTGDDILTLSEIAIEQYMNTPLNDIRKNATPQFSTADKKSTLEDFMNTPVDESSPQNSKSQAIADSLKQTGNPAESVPAAATATATQNTQTADDFDFLFDEPEQARGMIQTANADQNETISNSLDDPIFEELRQYFDENSQVLGNSRDLSEDEFWGSFDNLIEEMPSYLQDNMLGENYEPVTENEVLRQHQADAQQAILTSAEMQLAEQKILAAQVAANSSQQNNFHVKEYDEDNLQSTKRPIPFSEGAVVASFVKKQTDGMDSFHHIIVENPTNKQRIQLAIKNTSESTIESHKTALDQIRAFNKGDLIDFGQMVKTMRDAKGGADRRADVFYFDAQAYKLNFEGDLVENPSPIEDFGIVLKQPAPTNNKAFNSSLGNSSDLSIPKDNIVGRVLAVHRQADANSGNTAIVIKINDTDKIALEVNKADKSSKKLLSLAAGDEVSLTTHRTAITPKVGTSLIEDNAQYYAVGNLQINNVNRNFKGVIESISEDDNTIVFAHDSKHGKSSTTHIVMPKEYMAQQIADGNLKVGQFFGFNADFNDVKWKNGDRYITTSSNKEPVNVAINAPVQPPAATINSLSGTVTSFAQDNGTTIVSLQMNDGTTKLLKSPILGDMEQNGAIKVGDKITVDGEDVEDDSDITKEFQVTNHTTNTQYNSVAYQAQLAAILAAQAAPLMLSNILNKAGILANPKTSSLNPNSIFTPIAPTGSATPPAPTAKNALSNATFTPTGLTPSLAPLTTPTGLTPTTPSLNPNSIFTPIAPTGSATPPAPTAKNALSNATFTPTGLTPTTPTTPTTTAAATTATTRTPPPSRAIKSPTAPGITPTGASMTPPAGAAPAATPNPSPVQTPQNLTGNNPAANTQRTSAPQMQGGGGGGSMSGLQAGMELGGMIVGLGVGAVTTTVGVLAEGAEWLKNRRNSAPVRGSIKAINWGVGKLKDGMSNVPNFLHNKAFSYVHPKGLTGGYDLTLAHPGMKPLASRTFTPIPAVRMTTATQQDFDDIRAKYDPSVVSELTPIATIKKDNVFSKTMSRKPNSIDNFAASVIYDSNNILHISPAKKREHQVIGSLMLSSSDHVEAFDGYLQELKGLHGKKGKRNDMLRQEYTKKLEKSLKGYLSNTDSFTDSISKSKFFDDKETASSLYKNLNLSMKAKTKEAIDLGLIKPKDDKGYSFMNKFEDISKKVEAMMQKIQGMMAKFSVGGAAPRKP